jgi:hypothetical protein
MSLVVLNARGGFASPVVISVSEEGGLFAESFCGLLSLWSCGYIAFTDGT